MFPRVFKIIAAQQKLVKDVTGRTLTEWLRDTSVLSFRSRVSGVHKFTELQFVGKLAKSIDLQ